MNTKLLNKMKKLLVETLSLKLPDKNGELVPVYYLKQRFVDEPLFSKSVDEQVELLFPEERQVTVTAALVGHAELQMWINAAFTKNNEAYQISAPFWHVQDGSYFFDNFCAFDDFDVKWLNHDFVKNTEIDKLRIKINEYNENLELLNKALDPVSNYDIIWSSSLNHGRLNMYQIDQMFRKLYDLNNHRYYMVFTDYATWHFEDFPYVKLSNQPNDRSLLEDYEFNFESYDQDNELELRKIGINRQTHQMEFFYALKNKREIIAHMYFKQYA